jgi:wyosine [tRNA(Phe)-imidazoG37] synthetase (radical SAM superfamily)
MFTRGRRDNSTPAEVDAWIEAVKRIKPKRVDVYSLAREPADAQILEVPRERLDEIAKLCEKRTGIPAGAY